MRPPLPQYPQNLSEAVFLVILGTSSLPARNELLFTFLIYLVPCMIKNTKYGLWTPFVKNVHIYYWVKFQLNASGIISWLVKLTRKIIPLQMEQMSEAKFA